MTEPSAARRAALSVVVIVLFATGDALVKGHHGGTRNAIGNISATWALVPLLAGAFLAPRRVVAMGAVWGACATVLSLATYTLVRALSPAGDGGPRTASDVVGAAGNRWLVVGVVGGAALGVLGARLVWAHRWDVVVALGASLLVLEPVARSLWALQRGEGMETLLPSSAVWLSEIGIGFALAFVSVVHLALRRSRVASEAS